jgi:hypothetical protein
MLEDGAQREAALADPVAGSGVACAPGAGG